MSYLGEAIFVDDIDPPRECLQAVLVKSTVPHAKVVKIDASKALALPGVRGYFDHRDLPSRPKGPIDHDAEKVACRGGGRC